MINYLWFWNVRIVMLYIAEMRMKTHIFFIKNCTVIWDFFYTKHYTNFCYYTNFRYRVWPYVTICEIHKNAFNPVFTLYSSSLGIFRTSYNFIFNIFCYFGKQFRTSVLNLIPRNMCLNEMDNDRQYRYISLFRVYEERILTVWNL